MSNGAERRPERSGPDRRRFLASGVTALGGIALDRVALGSLGWADDRSSIVGAPSHSRPAHRALSESRQSRPRPSPSQLLWQQDELALFLHFGVNTFTNREWGDGMEDPALFDPSGFDPSQWAKIARECGFRAMILTAKHHDGFCLWPTETTRHSVSASPWRGGRGDVVADFVDACRGEGLRVGLYCSPWDRNHPTYGDSARYNDVYVAQLTELLTRYGDIHEVWFDGANGEGPDGRRQEYDWPRFWGHVLELQPNAVIFSDAGPGVRWIGNETGSAGDPNWSTVDPSTVPVPGMVGDEVTRQLQHGDPDGTVWRPGETDVSIRPGWFHHPEEDARVRTPENLVEIFFASVGRNSKLLLNVPPTREGILHANDVASLRGMRALLGRLFAVELTSGRSVEWRETGAASSVGEVTLPSTGLVGVVDLREDIAQGQRVARWTLELADAAGWRTVAEGETIGYRRLLRMQSTPVRAARLRVETLERPLPVEIRLYEAMREG